MRPGSCGRESGSLGGVKARPPPRPSAPRPADPSGGGATSADLPQCLCHRQEGGRWRSGQKGEPQLRVAEGMPQPVSPPPASPGVPCPKSGAGAGAQGTHSGKQATSHSQEGSLDRGHRLAGAAPGGGLALKPGGLVSDRERSSTGFVKDAVKQSTAFFPTLCSSRGQTVDLYTPHALQQQRSEFRLHEQALKHLKGTSISFILISKRHSIPASRGGGESCSSSPAPGGSPVPGLRHPPRT